MNDTYPKGIEVFRSITNKDGYFINWYRGRTEIKYVHQLQNIFFALTGEELKEIEK